VGVKAAAGEGLGAEMAQQCVLVVEDEPMVRTMLEVALQRWGFDVSGVGQLHEAQELLRSGLRPCLILMNLNLAQMKAYTFREWQSQQPELRHLPVIVITGGGLNEQLQNQLQATDYLSKPISFGRLRELLAKYCPRFEESGE
jgi:CheY-like chemotaxis protein